MKKCKHINLVLNVSATQEAYNYEGEWIYESVENIGRNKKEYRIGRYAYCKRCKRYLTKEEVDKLGIDKNRIIKRG